MTVNIISLFTTYVSGDILREFYIMKLECVKYQFVDADKIETTKN